MLDPAFATRLALGAADLVRHQLLSGGRPFVVNHLVTVRCNLRCPFCYVSGPEQDAWNREHYPRRDELGTAETRAFYRELVAEGFKLAVVLGGEPLLRDDLGEARGQTVLALEEAPRYREALKSLLDLSRAGAPEAVFPPAEPAPAGPAKSKGSPKK